MIKCIECKYYVPDEDADIQRRKKSYATGECHRYAPMRNTSSTWWADVADNDCCGEGVK